jgi:uncharacterized membrane protein
MTGLRARIIASAFAAGLATAALAGGPIYTYDYAARTPYKWNPASWGGQVPVYTDPGPLGILSQARANELVVNAAAQWSSVPTATFRATVAGDIQGMPDITPANIETIIGAFNGGGIYVIYDHDGTIMEDFFGLPATGVLGITTIELVETDRPELVEAWMVLSGPGIHANDPQGVGFGGVVTHEFGHAINLGHSQANGAIENPATLEPTGPVGCPTPWPGRATPAQVETMYPISTPEPGETGEFMATVDRIDDIAAVSDIYPAPGWPGNRGTISGKIFDSSGLEVIGVNVIARNVADPFNDFSSYISGQVSKGQAGPDGSFTLNGLTPGASYVIYVDNLLNGAFAVPRLVMLPGPEEYFNAATESGDGSRDNRCGFTTVKVAAGTPVTANIKFNHLPGAPTFTQGVEIGIATDITPDGSIVVGGFYNDGPIFRWDLNAGTLENLGGIMTSPPSISDDGTKIAGNVRGADDILRPAIYENGVWTPLPSVPGAVACNNTPAGLAYGSAWNISGDGSTVVGLSYGQAGCYSGTTRGFKWTAAGGTVQLPKVDAFDKAGRANAVNYDGSVIVGWDDATVGTRRGVQWRNGVASLIKRGANPVGEALDLTPDGEMIVGAINSATNGQAWRYQPSTGVEQLGMLPGQTGGTTNALNDDGSVITGFSTSLVTGILSPAIWTSSLGFSDLNQFFWSQGINTAGAAIVSGTAVSSDGRTIAGHMQTRFGFVPWALKIPTVLVCHAGQTTTVDFPQGMDAAILQGDVLGPCACSAAAPSDTPRISSAGKALVWNMVSDATGYDLTRGGLGALRGSGGDFGSAVDACIQDDWTHRLYYDHETPPPGDGFWYLVRARSCGGNASYDSGAPSQVGSRDAEIYASPYTCP